MLRFSFVSKIAITVLIFSFSFLTCSHRDKTANRLKVVVSIVPLADFVEQIAGTDVDVEVMVPPGASPHSYEPKPEQLMKVSQADLYIKVGTPIEFEIVWLEKILSLNKTMSVVDASANIVLLGLNKNQSSAGLVSTENFEQEKIDPHAWLAPLNAKIMVENIYQGLVALNPAGQARYAANKAAYIAQLEKLDRTIEQKLSAKKNRQFLVFHPSWSYFAERYQLVQLAIEHEGKEPTSRGLEHLVEQARQSGIKAVFASPQFSQQTAQVIAREIGGRVILISPLEKNYVENLTKLTDFLAEALK